ncbi:MAG: bifunctional UDP-N-acetylglucosamine diphosphorylase/glucosamine-1-phosphate N-acetyltransferase GlmU [Hyphomonadaceae bacterium]|nr:bifunctional UDP-N-acetylglucosamine diphosphorylase/glucosamine-1-phosphate N-acetyltransferase GlmU [Hyphomonadaceae bacterium]
MPSTTTASSAAPDHGRRKGRAAIILAAGQGTRMKSATPKVLHKVAGRTMLDWSIDACAALGCDRVVVVVGAHAPAVGEAAQARAGVRIAVQDPALGTAHAVRAAEAALADFDGDVIVTYADTPLVRGATLEKLFAVRASGAAVAVLGFEAKDPFGYGRLIRDAAGALLRIVEEKDASAEERAVTLCNSGVLVADRAMLFQLLSMVRNDNAKGEYYLTDVVGLARSSGFRAAIEVADEAEMMGVNSRVDLAAAEAAWQARRRVEAMASGVTMIDPSTVYLSHDTVLGADVTIEPGVFFGPGVTVAAGATVKAWSHLEGAHVGEGAAVGPFVRLRPGAHLGARVKIGNFVEVKNASFAEAAQASHLAYIGDAEVGARANIGCGAITCNYDGFDKWKTVIGEDAFIGSDTALVAPVRVGARAFTASGSVITKDVPDDALAVARGRQREIEGWAVTFRTRKLAERAARGGKRREVE